jgi:hypothetical protein
LTPSVLTTLAHENKISSKTFEKGDGNIFVKAEEFVAEADTHAFSSLEGEQNRWLCFQLTHHTTNYTRKIQA